MPKLCIHKVGRHALPLTSSNQRSSLVLSWKLENVFASEVIRRPIAELSACRLSACLITVGARTHEAVCQQLKTRLDPSFQTTHLVLFCIAPRKLAHRRSNSLSLSSIKRSFMNLIASTLALLANRVYQTARRIPRLYDWIVAQRMREFRLDYG